MQPTQKSATASLAQNLPSLDFQSPFSQPGWLNGNTTFLPLHMEKHYAYPLLIWLHGESGSDRELSQIMPRISLRNYVGIAPQLQRASSGDLAREPAGLDWPPLLDPVSDGTQADMAEQVFESLDKIRVQYNIHTDRIFIAGSGSGGSLALHLALQHSEHFAGAISLGGGLGRRESLLPHLRATRKTPIFLSQARDDRTYAEASLCEDLRLLHVGGFSVTARQYPGDRTVTDQMLHDIDVWMMEIINGYDMTATDQDGYGTY